MKSKRKKQPRLLLLNPPEANPQYKYYYCNSCHKIPNITLSSDLTIISQCDNPKKCSQNMKAFVLSEYANEIQKEKPKQEIKCFNFEKHGENIN